MASSSLFFLRVTPGRRISLAKLMVAQLVSGLPPFMLPESSLFVPLRTLCWAIRIHSVLSAHLLLGLPITAFPSCFPTNSSHAHARYVPDPSHPLCRDEPRSTWRGARIVKELSRSGNWFLKRVYSNQNSESCSELKDSVVYTLVRFADIDK